MGYKIKKYIAASLIAIYGMAISIAAIFMLTWDNKGAKSMWDKSANDWFFTIWLIVASLLVWKSVVKCLSSTYTSRNYLKILLFILILHVSFVVLSASKEATLYLGLPHIALALGVFVWWHAQQALTNSSS